jgi:nicotinamide-nucleotide amidase
MRASLLTIGDELLIGQVLNSNTQWMSAQFTDQNIAVTHHLTVGDEKARIMEALDYLIGSSKGQTSPEAIVIGGGLGPTHDDITMEVLAAYFGTPLKYDADWISQVESFFKSRNRVMSENNKKQGYLIAAAHRIDNDCGTAAGQHLVITPGLKSENKTLQSLTAPLHIFVVPGVPHEVKSMMSRYILPTLRKLNSRADETILKETLLTTGVGESLLSERLSSLVEKVKNDSRFSLAFLPSTVAVRLRLQLTAHHEQDKTDFKNAVLELRALCGADYFGLEPLTLEDLIVRELSAKGQSLALAESCTGGFLAHKITQISGSSQVLKGSLVCYQNEVKEKELSITAEFIAKNGVVSEATALAMADAIRTKWNATYGIGITGYLGPEGDAFAKPGTVWIALSTPTQKVAKSFVFEQNRERSKERSAQTALDLLRRHF